MQPLRVVFMGTPDFAATALQALIDAGHDLVAAYSQPPRPAGRGHQPQKSPVHELAERASIPVRTPVSLNTEVELAAFAALRPDVAVVAAYGLLLPPAILAAPAFGCLNIHASLLPRWRGAAPIQRAILAGDSTTGITIMQMDQGLDTGPMLMQQGVAIGPKMTAQELYQVLAKLGGELIVSALSRLGPELRATPQPSVGVTYAAKITKEEGRLEWRRPADELERRIRAFTPWPGAWCDVAGERLKVLAADVVTQSGAAPGFVLDDRLTIACGHDALRPALVQRPGKKPMSVEELLRGFPVPAGTRLA